MGARVNCGQLRPVLWSGSWISFPGFCVFGLIPILNIHRNYQHKRLSNYWICQGAELFFSIDQWFSASVIQRNPPGRLSKDWCLDPPLEILIWLVWEEPDTGSFKSIPDDSNVRSRLRTIPKDPCYSMWGSWTSRTGTAWKFIRHADSQTRRWLDLLNENLHVTSVPEASQVH